MITQIVVGVIGVVIPILWIWLNQKLNKLAEQNELAKFTVLLASKEMQEIATALYDEIKKKAEDGVITKEEVAELVEKLKQKAKESQMEVFEAFAPKAYEFVIKMMMAKATSK